jgi:hypothetical protein
MDIQQLHSYVTAMNHQYQLEAQVNAVFQQLNCDNQILGLCVPVTTAYTKLIESLLTPSQFSWLEYWMYDCDFGRHARTISIDNTHYNTLDMTFFKFWELVNA